MSTTALTKGFADTATLTGRSMRHIFRSPDTIITTAVAPIALMLLFVFVFGGALRQSIGSESYVNYLLPGILLIAIASGIAYTAFRLFTDLQGASSSASTPCRSRDRACCGRTC